MDPQTAVRCFVRVATVVPLVTIGLGILAQAAWAGDAEEIDLSLYYGFKPLEIYKLEDRSHSMLAGDFNHDGRTDLALIDNSHSRIDFLLQRTSRPKAAEAAAATKVNEISSHWRFEHAKLPVDRHLSAMAMGEFNGDGRTDLAYFGDPDRLVVHFQPESGDWDEKHQIRLADVERQPWGIAAGDLNSDGRDDLAVLGKRVTYLILQTAPGQFAAPVEIRNTAERLSLAMIGDLDGDARKDLFYLAADGDETKAAARLQNENRQLGPETRFDLEIDRGVILSDMLEGAGREVISIDGTTGRVRVAQFVREGDSDRKLPARLVQFGFGPAGGERGRDLAIGDLNGDGRSDVVVTDPDAAQLIVFLQHQGYGLDLGTAYPSFLGVEQVRLNDINGDGRAEVFVLSNKEKSIGLCELHKGRLSFPATLPVVGEPVAFEHTDLDGDGNSELVYLEKASRREYVLRTLTRQGEEEWVAGRIGNDDGKLELSNEPAYMQAIDANQDGRSDLLLTSAVGRPPTLLLTNADGVPQAVEAAGGLQLGDVERGAVFSGQLDAPVTLVAQGKFARNVLLDDEQRWQVLDQYNPAESGAKIEGVVTLDLDGAPGNELVLIDTGVGKLRIMRKQGAQYQPWEQIDIGTFPYIAADVGDLNSDGRDDLILFGAQRFLTLYAGQHPPALKELMTFESKLDDAFFVDLVAGDLNGDGKPDLAVFDIVDHHVEVLTSQGETLAHAINFKIFESKSFGRGGEGGAQPREGVVADVTGDGRDDLILLVHDRILVYPQDDGTSDDALPADEQPQTHIQPRQ